MPYVGYGAGSICSMQDVGQEVYALCNCGPGGIYPMQDVGQVVYVLCRVWDRKYMPCAGCGAGGPWEMCISLTRHFLQPHTALKPKADVKNTKHLSPTEQVWRAVPQAITCVLPVITVESRPRAIAIIRWCWPPLCLTSKQALYAGVRVNSLLFTPILGV